MMDKINCKCCAGENIVKRGLRRLKKSTKQVYFCKDCNHRFSLGLSKKKFDIKVILTAVSAYAQGYNYSEVYDLISRKSKVIVSKSSVERWVKEFDLGYFAIRERIVKKYGSDLFIQKMFKHSGLVYNFKFHKGKLNEFGKFDGLKKFIVSVGKGIDDKLFNSSANRCSQTKTDVSVDVKVYVSKLNKVVGDALKVVRSNKQRHSVVEKLMLHCDRDTVAVEVPVWYWDKKKNISVCGHIDILQVKFGKVWIFDYKPNAGSENYDSVVSQLFNYALGISFRSGVKLSEIKCGWFDEVKMYVFDSDKVRIHG
ncbi:MAG: hypothetical protein ABIC04_03990 [Nanoarchaeota archaeon]